MTHVSECNCGNCTNLWKPTCPYYAWVEKGNYGISSDSYIEFTSIVGCLSHPRAREVLMAEELAELERVSTEYRDTAKRIQNYLPSYVASGIDEAIRIIRYGVKKE